MRHARGMKPTAVEEYATERKNLSLKDIEKILDDGKKWNLAPTLLRGGTALFPHTYLHSCGHHIAACVHAALDSGADRVLVLGVMHALSERLFQSRSKEMDSKDISHEKCWGILGPGIERDDAWKNEFSLLNFLFLWAHEVRRRGIRSPELILRYPCLVNRHPEKIPGIRELRTIARDAVVLATSDLCHHGAAYGHGPKEALERGPEAILHARAFIQAGLDLFRGCDYNAFYAHCMTSKSDSLDVSVLLRYLLGPMQGTIHDVQLVDTASLYFGEPTPSWVAASLVELQPIE